VFFEISILYQQIKNIQALYPLSVLLFHPYPSLTGIKNKVTKCLKDQLALWSAMEKGDPLFKDYSKSEAKNEYSAFAKLNNRIENRLRNDTIEKIIQKVKQDHEYMIKSGGQYNSLFKEWSKLPLVSTIAKNVQSSAEQEIDDMVKYILLKYK